MEDLSDESDSNSASFDPAHLRRKRQKTGGDPVHLLLQQQQKQHKSDHQDGLQATNINCWNPSNVPAIKTEPRDTSPQPFGLYRAPPELTPSPQPHSPTNNYQNNNNTPSPYSMRTPAAGATTNPNLISPSHHFNPNDGGGGCRGAAGGSVNPTTSVTPMLQDYAAAYGREEQQQQHPTLTPQQQQQPPPFQGNPFIGPGISQWGEPKYAPVNNFISNQFAMHNLLASAGSGATAATHSTPQHWNLMHNPHHQLQQQHHPHPHQQQQQQPSYSQQSPAEAASSGSTNNGVAGGGQSEHEPTISNLLNFDSEQLVRINSEDQQMLRLNSEDLQISNLSIST